MVGDITCMSSPISKNYWKQKINVGQNIENNIMLGHLRTKTGDLPIT